MTTHRLSGLSVNAFLESWLTSETQFDATSRSGLWVHNPRWKGMQLPRSQPYTANQ